MSTPLPDEAPEDDAAAEAPASDEAATDDSVDSTEVIPKERFNGLQRKYQADKSAWEYERDELRAELQRLTEGDDEPDEEQDSVSDIDAEVLAELKALRADRVANQMAAARAEAIAKFPGAAKLAHLIVGDSPEAIMAMAEQVQTALSDGDAAGAASDDAGSDEDAGGATDSDGNEPPQNGGAASFDGDVTVDDAITEAVEAKDFSAFLRAAEARAASDSQGTDLTVG